jgi:integrase
MIETRLYDMRLNAQLPAARAKNGRAHQVPLSTAALAILAEKAASCETAPCLPGSALPRQATPSSALPSLASLSMPLPDTSPLLGGNIEFHPEPYAGTDSIASPKCSPVFSPVGFSQSKAKLEAVLAWGDSAPWTLHDLRRTCASGMAGSVQVFAGTSISDQHICETSERRAPVRISNRHISP